jgi:hypothetical protein
MFATRYAAECREPRRKAYRRCFRVQFTSRFDLQVQASKPSGASPIRCLFPDSLVDNTDIFTEEPARLFRQETNYATLVIAQSCTLNRNAGVIKKPNWFFQSNR